MDWTALGTALILVCLLAAGCAQDNPASVAATQTNDVTSRSAVPPASAVVTAAASSQGGVSPQQAAGEPASPVAAGGAASSEPAGATATTQPATNSAETAIAPATALATGNSEPDLLEQGRRLFASNCNRCHNVAGLGSPGPGGPAPAGVAASQPARRPGPAGGAMPAGPGGPFGGPGRGPSLANVAAKRSRDWLIAHVRNPKAHNPQSRMPPFEGKLKAQELEMLSDYVLSLK